MYTDNGAHSITKPKRLAPAMFHAVFERIRDKIDSKNTGEPRTNTDEHG